MLNVASCVKYFSLIFETDRFLKPPPPKTACFDPLRNTKQVNFRRPIIFFQSRRYSLTNELINVLRHIKFLWAIFVMVNLFQFGGWNLPYTGTSEFTRTLRKKKYRGTP